MAAPSPPAPVASASPSPVGGGFRQLPLERKLPLLILGLLAGILAIWLGLAYYEIREASRLAAAERLTTLSGRVFTSVEAANSTRLGTLRRVARDTMVSRALHSPEADVGIAAQNALAAANQRADSLTPAQLWTSEGRALGRIGLASPPEVQHAQTDVARLASSSDSGFVGQLVAAAGHVSYWIAVPVREGGKLIGFVAQERRLGSNPTAVAALSDILGQGINMYIRNADNSVWSDFAGRTLPPPTATETVDSLVAYTRRDSGRWLAAVHPLQGTPFVMSVEMPFSQIFARPRRTIRILAVLAILLVAGGGLIAWVISRRLARPLVDVTAAAESIAQGNYGRRVNGVGTDEVGRLATAFNQMAARVQASHDSSTHALRMEEFLGEASQLLAGSISDETLISDLARYCVPILADYCTIHIVDDDGAIRRVETAHHDPEIEPEVRALVAHYPNRVDGPGEIPAVIRSQKPLLIPRLDIQSIKKTAPNPEVATLFDRVQPSSFMCVPLVARGRAFGAMSFTMTRQDRQYTDDDLAVAAELARRTAVAIDNAMIYRRSLALRLEAEAASQAKSDFMAKMSHEIRTPINAMMGYAELIEMGLSGPINESQRSQLARIRSSGEHLTSLVGEILDLAKIEAGRMAVRPSVGVAGDAADAALALIRPQAASKGVLLSPKADGNAPAEYVGDPQRVQQILANLLANAVKFTEAGGSVRVRCGNGAHRGDSPRSWTWITVEDTGVGIAAEDHERIFQPFVQVDGGYTRSHGGTGLGLTISRNLAQMMGGDLTLDSASGRGSRFTLWLPSPTSCTE